MAFQFTCPYCHLRTLVDTKFSGSTGPCAGCGKTVTIPGTAPESIVVIEQNSKLRSRKAVLRGAIQYGVGVIAILLAVGLVGLFAGPAIMRAREVRNRSLCLTNMRQIVQALNSYAKTYGTYPPPYVVDSKGTPLYSWRVLILPQLGFDGVYSEFMLDQPWDSPTNVNIIRSMPEVFGSPASPDAMAVSESNYVLITGTGTIFPKTGPLGPDQIGDSHSQTILLAETTNSKLKWTEPGDIDGGLGIQVGNRSRIDIGGNHPGGANLMTVDATALLIPKDIAPHMLEALRTPNGGERIDTSDLQP